MKRLLLSIPPQRPEGNLFAIMRLISAVTGVQQTCPPWHSRVFMTNVPSSLRQALLTLMLLWFAHEAVAAEAAPVSKELDLSQYRGKVVLMDFWASWCAPCRQSFPWLNAMHSRYADRGLVVIGVNVDSTQADAAKFLRDVPADFQIVYDPQGTLAAQYDVPGMPSSFLIGRDGTIVARHVGFRDAARSEREAELRKLLSSVAGAPAAAHP